MKQLIELLAPAAVAGLLAWLLTPVSVWLARQVGAIDHPGPRRVHDHPVPRLGGLAVVGSTVVLLGVGMMGVLGARRWAAPSTAVGILAGLVPILAVSIRDDISRVRPLPKFVAHAIGAGIAMAGGMLLPPTIHLFGMPLPLGWVAIPLSALWLVGVTNAFNIVDGLDGLSAGLGLISAAGLVGVLLVAREPALATAVLVLAGAIVGFLPYNLHPARVFLGDSGATAIGYLLACFTLASSAKMSAGFATAIPVVLIGVPIADTLVAMVRRAISRLENGTGNHIYEADHNHIHHRLLALGFSHQKAVILLCAVGSFLALMALLSLLLTRQQAGLMLTGILLAGLVGLKRLGYGEFALLQRGVALRLYDLPVLRRSFFVVFVDIAVIAVALYLTIGLKRADWWLATSRGYLLSALTVLIPAHVIAFTLFGVYRASWRLAGVDAVRRLCSAVILASVASVVLLEIVRFDKRDISLFGLYMFVELVLATGSRVSYRILDQLRSQGTIGGTPTLIYGAGVGGSSAVREMLSNGAVGLTPVGFIDDNPGRAGKSLNGYPTLGNVDQLESALSQCGARVVVVSSHRIPDHKVAQVQRVCESRGVRLLRMRIGFDEVSSAREGVSPATLNVGKPPDCEDIPAPCIPGECSTGTT